MLRIFLIRPGATDYDQQRRIQGTLDVPLNEQGHAEVARLIEQLRGRGIETIYTSASEPALQTAQAIAKALDIRLKKLDRMQNLDFGLWQGMRIEEVRLRQPKVYRQWQEQPDTVCPPQGEMLSQAEARISAVLTPLLKRHREGAIGIVLPEPLATVVRRWLNQSDLGDLWKTGDEHGRWEVLEVERSAVVQII